MHAKRTCVYSQDNANVRQPNWSYSYISFAITSMPRERMASHFTTNLIICLKDCPANNKEDNKALNYWPFVLDIHR